MLKKCIAAVLCLLLIMSVPGFAQMASQGYELDRMERYSSFGFDELTGEWIVYDPRAEAAIDALADVRNSMKDGIALYHVRLSGNAFSGSVRPEIEIFHFANKPLGVRAVTFIADGVRYDMRANGVETYIGSFRAESIVVPMENIDHLRAIAAAEDVVLILHGRNGVYRTEISASYDGNGAKQNFEKLSLDCDLLVTELDALHIDSYGLWDVSRGEWEAALGFEPMCLVSESGEESLLMRGDKGDDVNELQQLLVSAGFYAGSYEKEFGAKTVAAVARAQEYYGLIVSGCADDALMACLLDGDEPAAAEDAHECETDTLGDIELCVERWWLARKVNASGNAGAGLICSDSSNTYAVCEGFIKNNGSAQVGLGWEVSAELVINNTARYDCTLRVECNDGNAFGTSLLPLAGSRLVALAEIPQDALNGAHNAYIVFSNGTDSVGFSLIGDLPDGVSSAEETSAERAPEHKIGLSSK